MYVSQHWMTIICNNDPDLADQTLVLDQEMHSDSLRLDAVSYSEDSIESWQTAQERKKPRASAS